MTAHLRQVLGVSFSPDGQRLAIALNDGTVQVWDAQTGQLAITLRGSTSSGEVALWRSPITTSSQRLGSSVAFSHDGNLIAAAFGMEAWVWDATSTADKPDAKAVAPIK